MFRFSVAFGLGLLLPKQAHALQPGDVIPDVAPIFDDTSAVFAPNGLGSLSVSWDARLGRWIMIMEYQATATDPACPHGIWGLAGSMTADPTGATGWLPPISLWEPTVDGSYASCVTAHPAGLWGYNAAGASNNRGLHIMFKAETDTTVAAATCPVGTNVNDCVYTGVGLLNLRFGPAGRIVNTTRSAAPLVNIDVPFGFQSPVQLPATGEFYLLVQIGDDIYSTRTTNPLLGWSSLNPLPPPVMSPGANSWNDSLLFNPEVVCQNGALVSLQGGRTLAGGVTSEGGWSEAVSLDNGVTWTLDPDPIVTWNDDLQWRHWAAVPVGQDAYYIWYVDKDPASQHLRIWRAEAIGAGAVVGTPIDRYCL